MPGLLASGAKLNSYLVPSGNSSLLAINSAAVIVLASTSFPETTVGVYFSLSGTYGSSSEPNTKANVPPSTVPGKSIITFPSASAVYLTSLYISLISVPGSKLNSTSLASLSMLIPT